MRRICGFIPSRLRVYICGYAADVAQSLLRCSCSGPRVIPLASCAMGCISVKHWSFGPHSTPLDKWVGVCGRVASAMITCGRSLRFNTVLVPSVQCTVVLKAVPV